MYLWMHIYFLIEPEELSYHEIPKLELSMHFSDYEFERCGSPDLPEISDDETF